MLIKRWSIVGQSLVNPGQKLTTGWSTWPTFDQDLTNPLVKRYLKRGRSKVGQIDYPLTNIRLTISGQCYECRNGFRMRYREWGGGNQANRQCLMELVV